MRLHSGLIDILVSGYIILSKIISGWLICARKLRSYNDLWYVVNWKLKVGCNLCSYLGDFCICVRRLFLSSRSVWGVSDVVWDEVFCGKSCRDVWQSWFSFVVGSLDSLVVFFCRGCCGALLVGFGGRRWWRFLWGGFVVLLSVRREGFFDGCGLNVVHCIDGFVSGLYELN